MRCHLRNLTRSLFPYLVVVFAPSITAAESILDCGEKVQQILNGTLTIGDINNVTIHGPYYMYYGPVHGLEDSYPRDDYLTLTYEGKSPNPLPGWDECP